MQEVINAIKSGANVNAKNKSGYTALMWAAFNGRTENINALAKAYINATDNKRGAGGGRTALMYAAERGHIETVNALLKAGADVNIRDNLGNTALMQALYEGHTKIVNALIKAKADVNAKDNEGSTAIMDAILYSVTMGMDNEDSKIVNSLN